MKNAEGRLKTHHTFLDFLYWNLVTAVPFITACIAIAKNSIVWLIGYIIFFILLLAVIIRFYCAHCPHYRQGSKTLKCMFFWGIPKYFKARPEPLTLLDKTLTLVSATLIVSLPVYWLWLQPGLLVIYILSCGVMAATLRRYECPRCVYLKCPANCVPKDFRHSNFV